MLATDPVSKHQTVLPLYLQLLWRIKAEGAPMIGSQLKSESSCVYPSRCKQLGSPGPEKNSNLPYLFAQLLWLFGSTLTNT